MTTVLSSVEPDISSLEYFTRNQYYGYTKQTGTKTREFTIEHPHWNIFPAISFDMKLDAGKIYGEEFGEYFQQPPCTRFLMDGSRTKVSFPVLL
jgi:hypothetical protein